MVREAYRNYKQNSYLTYIFAPKDFADVARRIANIRGVAKLREAKLCEIAETAQEVGRQQELLVAQQQALDSTRRKIDAQRPVTNATSATPRHDCNACRRAKRSYCAKRSGRRSSSTRPSPNCRNSPRATRREPVLHAHVEPEPSGRGRARNAIGTTWPRSRVPRSAHHGHLRREGGRREA